MSSCTLGWPPNTAVPFNSRCTPSGLGTRPPDGTDVGGEAFAAANHRSNRSDIDERASTVGATLATAATPPIRPAPPPGCHASCGWRSAFSVSGSVPRKTRISQQLSPVHESIRS